MASSVIGIVVAMSTERIHLLDLADDVQTGHEGPWRFDSMTLHGQNAIVATSGIGLINAAAATEWLINSHHLDYLINFGCAGAHRRDLLPGDVIIATELVNHTGMQILPDGSERYTGFTDEFGGELVRADTIRADPELVTLASQAAEEHPPVSWPRELYWPANVDYREPLVAMGPVASADTWTQAHSRLDLLHGRHGSLCEDMEAAAVGRVASLHNLPILVIKDISNNEYLRSSNLATFDDFPVSEVGKRAANLVGRTVQLLQSR